MPTNESVMLDMIAQLENLWMGADTPTTAKHYHRVYDIAWDRLTALRQVSYLPYTGAASAKVVLLQTSTG